MIPTLRLTITQPDDVPADRRVRAITGTTLHIGREGDNDWVLADSARLMSRHHCTIEFRGGVYVVVDTSANGVFLNDAVQPLGQGNSRILSDGDVLRLPGLVLAVALIEDNEVRDAFRSVLPPRSPGAFSLPSQATQSEPPKNPLARPGGVWDEDFSRDFSHDNPFAAAAHLSDPTRFASLPLGASNLDDPGMDWMDERTLRPDPGATAREAAWARLDFGDRVEAEHQAFQSALPGQSFIPEDWALEDGPDDGKRAAPAPDHVAGLVETSPAQFADDVPASSAPPPDEALRDGVLLRALATAFEEIERTISGLGSASSSGSAPDAAIVRLRTLGAERAAQLIEQVTKRATTLLGAAADRNGAGAGSAAASRPGDFEP